MMPSGTLEFPVKTWYGRRMNAWEMDLATRSTDRVVRPFDWGLDWTAGLAVPIRLSRIRKRASAN